MPEVESEVTEQQEEVTHKGQMPNQKNQCFCQKQRIWMADKNFYKYKDGSRQKMCKKCLTMHVDNFDESTYLWILKDLDTPYIPEKWKTMRDRAFARNPNLTGLSVLGKYVAAMKIKPWTQYGWADSQKLQQSGDQKNKEKIAELDAEQEDYKAQLKQKLDNGEISEAEYKTLMPIEIQHLQAPPVVEDPIVEPPPADDVNPFHEDNFIKEEDLPDPAADLTDDDKKYLAVKWGRLYKPNEWVQLEDNYQKMTKDFKIDNADTQNTLMAICKVNLKMNQALDMGDLDGFTKLSRTYETLRKSANFTAVQNSKKEKSQDFTAIGQVIAFAEKQGGAIHELKIKEPKDIVDSVIMDLKTYNKTLVEEDPALSREIEDYLKKMTIQAEVKEREKQARAQGKNYLDVSDQDISDFEQFKTDAHEQDRKEEQRE